MAIILAGGIIEQSGTDTDLSDLTSVANATTIDLGTKNIYELRGSTTFTISGNLTINPQREGMITNVTGLIVQDGGVLNIGSTIDLDVPANATDTELQAGTGIVYQQGIAFLHRATVPRISFDVNGTHSIRIESGGTLNWNGGAIEIEGTFFVEDGANINITGGELYQYGGAVMRLENGAGININGFTKQGGFLYVRNGQPTRFDGFVPIACNDVQASNPERSPYALLNYGADATGSAALSTPITFNDYSGIGNVNDVAILDNGYSVFNNPELGTSIRIQSWLGNNSRSDGRVDITKDYNFTVRDSSTTNLLTGINFFSRDVDNGTRGNHNFARQDSDSELATDMVYSASSDTDGVASINYLLRALTMENDLAVDDFRIDTESLDVNVTAFSYLYNIVDVNLGTTGIGALNTDLNLTVDSMIEESDTDVVAAYDGITIDYSLVEITIDTETTINKLYDFVKYSITRPTTAGASVKPIETYSGTGGQTIASIAVSGSALEFGGDDQWKLVVNDTLAVGTTLSALDGIYELNAAQTGITLNGEFSLNGTEIGSKDLTTCTLSGTLAGYSGNAQTAIWRNPTFTSTFAVDTDLDGTGHTIDLRGTIDTTLAVVSDAITALETQGFTVLIPLAIVTMPSDAGSYILYRTDSDTDVVVESYTASQEVEIPAGGTYDLYYKPANNLGSNSVYPVNRLTGLTSSSANSTASSVAYTNILIGSLIEPDANAPQFDSENFDGVANVARFDFTSTTASALEQQEAKYLLLSLTDRDSYLLAVAHNWNDGNISADLIQPLSNATEVNVTYITLNTTGFQNTLGNVLTTGTGSLSNLTSVSANTFVSNAPQDGISEGQVQNALNNSTVATDVAGIDTVVQSMATDNLLGIRPRTHTGETDNT